MQAESPVRSRGSDSAAPAQERSRGRWASIHERLAALKPTGRQQKVQSSWSYPRIHQLPGRPRSRTRLRNERKRLCEPALDMAPARPIRGLRDPLLARVIRSAAVAAHVLRVRSPTKERLPNHHVQGEPTRLRVQVPEPLCLRRGQRQARKVEIFGSNPLNAIRKCCSPSDRDRSIHAITIESYARHDFPSHADRAHA